MSLKKNISFTDVCACIHQHSLFFLVLARDLNHVFTKIQELDKMGFPYIIVCGQRHDHPNIVFREPLGKYDAINYGFNLIPNNIEFVVLNDVDTQILNFAEALKILDNHVGLVYAKVIISEGPQKMFSKLYESIRTKFMIGPSGELMLIRRQILESILPLKPCKAEDAYIMFKVIETGYKVVYSDKCLALTERTKTNYDEINYKRRTTCGIYQALSMTNPPIITLIFYALLPFSCLMLLVLGKVGFSFVKGIWLGLIDYMRGDLGGKF